MADENVVSKMKYSHLNLNLVGCTGPGTHRSQGEAERRNRLHPGGTNRDLNAGTADGEPCRSCNHAAWDRELDLGENIEMIGESEIMIDIWNLQVALL